MLRKILGAIVGYIVVFIWVAVTLSLSWMILGADFAFQEGTTNVSMGWVLVMLGTGFVGAILAGWVAALIAKHRGGATALAVVILVLGFLMAFLLLGVDVASKAGEALAGRSPADLGPMEAVGVAVNPQWYNFANPIIGALGVILGGSLWARGRETASPTA